MDTVIFGIPLMLLASVGIYWAVYAVVLLILMKMQGWRVSLFALLASTALATALAQIPVVGPYVATAVLVLCIWKASGSDLIDSLFSVVIAGALMFAFKLFVLTALVGDLRVSWGNAEGSEPVDPDAVLEVPAANSWDGPDGDEKSLLYLKGITLSSNKNVVLIGSGTAHYAFTAGERAVIPSPRGRLAVFCEAIHTNETVVRVDLKERKYRLTLVLHKE